MRRLIICLMAFSALLIFGERVFAACTPGTSWTATWTDSFSQTTYQLTAPCKVYLNIPFSITATVTDSAYPNDLVGGPWSIIDNGSTIASGNWNDTVGGTWTRTISQTYTGTAIDHTIQFSFKDMGQGGGAHGFSASVIGDLTVDPFLGKMARNSWYLSPEGWIVVAYTKPDASNEVYLEVIDTGKNLVNPLSIAGLTTNPKLITNNAVAPEVSISFNKTTKTAYVTYTSAAGRQVVAVPGIRQAP